jgi:DNA polymerase-3 subunit alpha
VIEALIKAGAFDNLGGSRAQMIAAMEKAMQVGANLQSDIQKGQMNFFGSGAFGCDDNRRDQDNLPKVAPWSEMQMLTYEKEVLGFYVTSNPLSRHADVINAYSKVNTAELTNVREGMEVVIGGMVTKIRQMVTKNGKNAGAKMAVFELEDLQGTCEVVMFPKSLENWGHQLTVDKILFVRGTVDCRRETPNILCDELIELEDASDKLAANVWIRLGAMEVTEEKVTRIRSLCAKHRGKSPVHISLQTAGGYRIAVVADAKLSVRPDVEFCERMREVVGADKLELRRR